jgi:IS605 OrfB family transposase
MKKNPTNTGGVTTSAAKKASESTVIITRKIEIFILEEDKEIYKQKKERLYDMRYHTFRAANKIVVYHYSLFNKITPILKDKTREEQKEIIAGELGTSIENSSYQMISEEFTMLPSYVRASLNRKVYGQFKNNIGDVLRGRRTLATYRLGMPIPFMAANELKKQVIDGKERIVYSLINDIQFVLNFGRDRSGNALIVSRIMDGEYKMCDSAIEIADDGKMYLLLSVKHSVNKVLLDYNKIAATNLGMNCPMYVSTNTGQTLILGSKDEFLRVRTQLQARRRDITKNLVTAKGGHGRKRKMKSLDHIAEVERNFARTYNHKLSKQLVMFCVNNGIGTIKTENLLGGSKTLEKTFILRNWSYFELHSQIEYKAKMYGIKVMKVDAHNITRKCHVCGTIDEHSVDLEDRKYNCQNNQCTNYQKPINIDYNASVNVLNSPELEEKPKKESKKKEQ